MTSLCMEDSGFKILKKDDSAYQVITLNCGQDVELLLSMLLPLNTHILQVTLKNHNWLEVPVSETQNVRSFSPKEGKYNKIDNSPFDFFGYEENVFFLERFVDESSIWIERPVM